MHAKDAPVEGKGNLQLSSALNRISQDSQLILLLHLVTRESCIVATSL